MCLISRCFVVEEKDFKIKANIGEICFMPDLVRTSDKKAVLKLCLLTVIIKGSKITPRLLTVVLEA